jgi:hypothetical protein
MSDNTFLPIGSEVVVIEEPELFLENRRYNLFLVNSLVGLTGTIIKLSKDKKKYGIKFNTTIWKHKAFSDLRKPSHHNLYNNCPHLHGFYVEVEKVRQKSPSLSGYTLDEIKTPVVSLPKSFEIKEQIFKPPPLPRMNIDDYRKYGLIYHNSVISVDLGLNTDSIEDNEEIPVYTSKPQKKKVKKSIDLSYKEVQIIKI